MKLSLAALNAKIEKLAKLANSTVGDPADTRELAVWNGNGKLINLIPHDPDAVAANVMNIIVVPSGKLPPIDENGNWLPDAQFRIPEGMKGAHPDYPGRVLEHPGLPIWREPPSYEGWKEKFEAGLKRGLQVVAGTEVEATPGDPEPSATGGSVIHLVAEHSGLSTPDFADPMPPKPGVREMTDPAEIAEFEERARIAREEHGKPDAARSTMEHGFYKSFKWIAPNLDAIPSLGTIASRAANED